MNYIMCNSENPIYKGNCCVLGCFSLNFLLFNVIHMARVTFSKPLHTTLEDLYAAAFSVLESFQILN